MSSISENLIYLCLKLCSSLQFESNEMNILTPSRWSHRIDCRYEGEHHCRGAIIPMHQFYAQPWISPSRDLLFCDFDDWSCTSFLLSATFIWDLRILVAVSARRAAFISFCVAPCRICPSANPGKPAPSDSFDSCWPMLRGGQPPLDYVRYASTVNPRSWSPPAAAQISQYPLSTQTGSAELLWSTDTEYQCTCVGSPLYMVSVKTAQSYSKWQMIISFRDISLPELKL